MKLLTGRDVSTVPFDELTDHILKHPDVPDIFLRPQGPHLKLSHMDHLHIERLHLKHRLYIEYHIDYLCIEHPHVKYLRYNFKRCKRWEVKEIIAQSYNFKRRKREIYERIGSVHVLSLSLSIAIAVVGHRGSLSRFAVRR